MLRYKLMALKVLQTIVRSFIAPVLNATGTSIKATLSLPYNIVKAIEEAQTQKFIENELDEALIDATFFDKVSKK